MKNIIAFLFLISAMCGFAGAQSSLPELEIAKEINLLGATRSDVKMIMSEFDSETDDEDEDDGYFYQEFHSDKTQVIVSYSTGDCSQEGGIRNQPEWNFPKLTATKVVITFKDEEPKLNDLGLNLSRFKKKLQNEDDDESEEFIYYDEKAGIIVLTDEGEVEKIILHPPKKQSGSLCDNENNSDILSGEKSFAESIVNSDTYCILLNAPSNVTNLNLRTNGVFGCKNEKCLDAKKEIAVETTAVDNENDQLVYSYIVSGGKITGSGANVIWDLTDVLPGTYEITAGSDDGCGICGETKTREILVKENSYEVVNFVAPAKIKELILDKTELIAGCPAGRLRRSSCPTGNCGISVTSVADVKNLTYKYLIDGGETNGSGDKIVWDLAGLRPGEYSVTVSASDDGTNFGEPKTATVVIKENTACSEPKK